MSDPKGPDGAGIPQQAMTFGIPQYYANGFQNIGSVGDVTTVFLWNDRPVTSITMSLTAAKTFATSLLDMIRDFERESKSEVKTFQELMTDVAKARAA